ncbi:MAG: hypothetical protein IPM54_10870 [Polyangiaceae bacterium]|nr:hypothetical protein [Polyangiaceae bacterium]
MCSKLRLAVLIGAMFLAGCGSAITTGPTVSAGSTLRHHELANGRVALLPVAAQLDQVPLYDLQWLDMYIGRAFDQRANGIKRVSNGEVLQALQDPETYEAIVNLARTKQISLAMIKQFADKLGVRYVVFTTVDWGLVNNPFDTALMGYGPTAVEITAAGDVYKSAKLDARVVIIDAYEGRVCWESEFGSSQPVAKIGDPHAQKLAFMVFATIFGKLPEPVEGDDHSTMFQVRSARAASRPSVH